MSLSTDLDSKTPSRNLERQWFVIERWAEYRGELRANLLRIIAIGVFYAIELLNYYGLHVGPFEIEATSDRRYHLTVTGLAVAWAMIALVAHFCLHAGIFSAALKYLTTAADLLLLTWVLVAGDGPRSAMVVGYFLVLILAALRFRLRLIRCATAGALIGYVGLLGYAKWYAPEGRDLTVPRYAELIMCASLALAGVMLGQLIRRVRAMAVDFAGRLERAP